MKITAPPSDIQIIAYTAVNKILNKPNDDNKISSYTRSFRYESPDLFTSRRLAFFKLLDEKQCRLFCEGDLVNRSIGLSLQMEYLVPVVGQKNAYELKKMNLLTGNYMTTLDQLQRWEKELNLLQKALPDQHFPVMPVDYGDGRVFEILETEYWIKQYYFYE
jgi:hypothetical protein